MLSKHSGSGLCPDDGQTAPYRLSSGPNGRRRRRVIDELPTIQTLQAHPIYNSPDSSKSDYFSKGIRMSASEQPWANTEGNALNDKTNAKSSSLDNLLLLLAVLLFAGLCVTLVGIIPVLIMAVGAIQAFRSGDVKNMKVTARFVQSLVILGTLIFGFIGAYKQTDVDDAATRVQAANTAYTPHINEGYMQPYEFSTKLTPAEQHEFSRVADELWNAKDYYRRSKEKRNQFLAIAGGISSIALIIEFLWIRPFTRQLPAWQAARALKKRMPRPRRNVSLDATPSRHIASRMNSLSGASCARTG